MHFGTIKPCDIANGIGVRVSLFVSGCRNRCPHCFQPETWDFAHGEPFTAGTEAKILALLAPDYIAGLTVLGGEPLEPENQAALLPFLRRVKAEYPQKTIWIYTGFTLEELSDPSCRACCGETAALLALVDVLVDGRFVEAEKDITLRFRGSKNQRLIDLPATLRTKTCVLWNG